MSKVKNKSNSKEIQVRKGQKKQIEESRLYKETKMNDIFSVLNQQEETITALLNKYQTNTVSYQDEENKKDQLLFGDNKQNLNRNKIGYKNSQSKEDKSYQDKVRMELLQYKKSKSLTKKKSKSKLIKLQLPLIKIHQKNSSLSHQANKVQLSMVSERGRKKSISGIGNINENQRQRQKTISFKKQLEKIYAQNGRRAKYNAKKSHSSRLKSKQSIQYEDQIYQGKSRYKINKQTHSNATALTPQQTQSEQLSIPHPISYYTLPKPPVRQHEQKNQDDDSEEQQVPLAYYQRQFKQKIRGQCIQQINYLYFSKNESIKQWSQNLLGMFQKHDKELLALRNKSRYLKKFDDNFFAVDIYKN